ncbi:MAG: hypothetical protein R2805_00610 [Flavobacterium sp.]|uniref:hypothetical protein n=1 Tax=Flavobacterium sp. TaxID=239 RepID=UPI0035299709
MKQLVTLFFIFISFTINSQVCIGKASYFTEKTAENTIEEINNFKNTITVVVLPEKNRVDFENIIKEYWDVTKFEFVTLSDYEKNKEKYIYPTYSLLKFENYNVQQQNSSTYWNFININLVYSTIKNFKPKGKSTFESVYLASVYLSPVLNFKYRNYEDYNSGNSIMNYQTGFFKNQIQFINSNIKSNSNFNCLDEYIDNGKVSQLKTKKLYILNKARENFQMVLKNEIDSELNKILSKYKYEFISSDDLQSKILNKEEDFYYLLYSQINSKKIITIINSKTGEIIYSFLERLSYSLKDNDFKKISNDIEKT